VVAAVSRRQAPFSFGSIFFLAQQKENEPGDYVMCKGLS
jgi:hypothetical protein